jgi:hypothetical protein
MDIAAADEAPTQGSPRLQPKAEGDPQQGLKKETLPRIYRAQIILTLIFPHEVG